MIEGRGAVGLILGGAVDVEVWLVDAGDGLERRVDAETIDAMLRDYLDDERDVPPNRRRR